MPILHQVKLPPPLDWQEFQRMTCDLYKRIWRNQYIKEFGTIGQRQNGVDVYGFVNQTIRIEGVQCKCVEKMTPKNVMDEYNESQSFRPKLSRFIIVTTTKRDTKIQQKAAELTVQGPYACEVVFWKDFCQYLAEHTDILKKYFSDFFLIETVYDSPGKLIKIDIDVNHYEILISRINPKDDYYKGTILISDLLSRKCITYRLGDHWSRLEDIVGITKCDAFLVSKWLNSFSSIESLLRIGKTVMSYELSDQDKKDAKENGFMIMNC